MKWPAKKDAIANGSVSKPDEWSLGFNACHDEFMKVLQNDEIFLSFQKWLDGEGRHMKIKVS